MRYITLAKKSHRILAALIDFLIIFICSLIIFVTVSLPLTLDMDKYVKNDNAVVEIYKESGLFLHDEKSGLVEYKSKYPGYYTKLSHLTNRTIKVNETDFHNQNLSKDLYTFYCEKYINFDGIVNLNEESYANEILKVNSKESNIKEINFETFEITCIDPEKTDLTIHYFLNEYNKASNTVANCTRIRTHQSENESMMLNSIIWIFPIVAGFGAIFYLIIPLCNKDNRTIGKMIYKLSVVDGNGYKLKKGKLVVRYLAYIIFEFILGFVTFGGTFLISYTTFLFSKNRRSIHDFIANTAVIDSQSSIIFKNAVEEKYYMDKGGIDPYEKRD